MKKLRLLIILLFISYLSQASQLFLLPVNSQGNLQELFGRKEFTIHYYNDRFIIGSTESVLPPEAIVLDQLAWVNRNTEYFLLSAIPADMDQYSAEISSIGKVLYKGRDFLILASEKGQIGRLFPALHSGIIRISENAARYPVNKLDYKRGSLNARDDIFDMIAQVNTDTLHAFVQHLQDFGTRNAYKTGGVQAQNWIYEKFESYGLSVELHDFWMPGGSASDNVIATLTGTKYPDEYVVLGAHYDSYAWGSNEPGADDNATGTAGILEAARILSQYQFDRTIIFATWSGEEYGLYGSSAWASEAADDGMNILGYFNIDMAGYLREGDEIHTDIIAPSSAAELRQFYKDVCAIYLPDFQVFDGSLSGGDSDHTSFNENGYQGIFPFEDSQFYSPYIHSSNDLIGPSVNNFEQHTTFVKAIIANVVTMSEELPAPQNLAAAAGDRQVYLTWDTLAGTEYYNVYRNDDSIPLASPATPFYLDTNVVNGTTYSYNITAIFTDSGNESEPSGSVTVVPLAAITFPFFDDFESGALYWSRQGTWGLIPGTYHSASYSLTESPNGLYQPDLDISATLRSFDLSNALSAEVSFWIKYSTESGNDFLNFEIYDGNDWNVLDQFDGTQNDWLQLAYSLDNYTGNDSVVLRFRFISNINVEAQGVNIDDLEITVNGVGIGEIASPYKTNLFLSPNPANDAVTLNYWLENDGPAKISLYSPEGRIVMIPVNAWEKSGGHNIVINTVTLRDGLYFITLETNGKTVTQKLIISRP